MIHNNEAPGRAERCPICIASRPFANLYGTLRTSQRHVFSSVEAISYLVTQPRTLDTCVLVTQEPTGTMYRHRKGNPSLKEILPSVAAPAVMQNTSSVRPSALQASPTRKIFPPAISMDSALDASAASLNRRSRPSSPARHSQVKDGSPSRPTSPRRRSPSPRRLPQRINLVPPRVFEAADVSFSDEIMRYKR